MTSWPALDHALEGGPPSRESPASTPVASQHGALRRVARIAAVKLGEVLLVVAVVGSLTFLLLHLLPGDPAANILGTNATPSNLAALREQLGLNRSLPGQFGLYLWHLAHLNLGTSLVQRGRPVLNIITADLAVTGPLIGLTIVLSLIIGVPLGLWSAVTPRASLDVGLRTASIMLLAIPPFLVGIVLTALFALQWRVAPAGGWGSGWPDDLRYLWLPSLALSLGYLAPMILRTVRQSAFEVWREPYVEAALSRGINPRRVVFRHVLPNSALPLVTLIGFSAAMLIGSAVVVEVVFALPGLGSQLLSAVQERDYPVVQGIALFTGAGVVLINMIADILYTLIDPRTRRGAR